MALAVAAGVAACALLVALPALRLRLQADHLTSTAQIRQVRLQDGSTVQLGPDSAIAVDYDRGARRVRLLSGQAMFEVVPDAARPFRVTAGEVTTTVLGTAFDVRMIGCETSVAVSRGHVRVENAAAGPAASLDLRAGEWIRIGADAAAQTGSIAPTLVGGWQQAQVLAENRTIGSVVDEIRPWYAGRIVVIDAALAGRPVTGVYSLRDPVQALTLLVAPHGGRVTRITPWLLMVSAP